MKGAIIVFGTLLLVAGSALFSGCGSSSTTGQNSVISTASGYGGFTSCTSNGTTITQCMPNLANYVHFRGAAYISNPRAVQKFISGFPSFIGSPTASSSQLNFAMIDLILNPTGNGPQITLSVTFPWWNQALFTGYTTFATSTTSTNSDVGTFTMSPLYTWGASMSVTSIQPLDGTIPVVSPVSVLFDGQNAGQASLQITYP